MRWSALSILVPMMTLCSVCGAGDYTLGKADKLPSGFGEKIAEALNPEGIVVQGTDGPVCTIWLARSLTVKPKFKPSLSLKYPLTPGQLIGSLQVHIDTFSDFREQTIKPGLYTLRYGHQPQDGNHVGTSEVSDFLLAVPAASDTDPALVKPQTLFKRSAKATGSNHPAIFSLLSTESAGDTAGLTEDTGKHLWILSLTGTGKEGDADAKVPLRIVVIGKSEG